MKKLLEALIIILIGYLVYFYRHEISEYISLNFIYKNEFTYKSGNSYQKDEFVFFNKTNSYMPQNKDDILSIIYTGINSGYDTINFYCSYSYKTCMDDLKEIIENDERISYINNFVSPYNTYKKLNFNLESLGKVSIEVEKYYTDREIKLLNEKIDSIINEIIKPNMTQKEKLRAIHDYIIEHTIYDKEKEKYLNTDVITTYNSELAIGPIFEGHGICSGYSDAYSLFLDKLGVKNYRISNNDHIWNFVFLDNSWYHIDLTWDDPVTNTGVQVLRDDYFLITTNDLINRNIGEHNFNENIFIEAKK